MKNDAAALQSEATRAAFRQYGCEASLTPEFEALVTRLELIDVGTSSIRCQGQCKNGGRCSQRIDKNQVALSVLQLQSVALGTKIVGNALFGQLEYVFERLLCGSAHHRTQVQVARCAIRGRLAVEAWREKYVNDEGPIVKEEEEEEEEEEDDVECKGCAILEDELTKAYAQRDRMIEENDELQKDFAMVVIERNEAVEKVDQLYTIIQRLRGSREEAAKREKGLAEQLRTLQIKHDGLMGRMASEAEQHQQVSRENTPKSRGSRASAVPLSKFAFTGASSPKEGVRLTPEEAGPKTTRKQHDEDRYTRAATPTDKASSMHRPRTPTPYAEANCPGPDTASRSSTPPMNSSPFAGFASASATHGMLDIGNTKRAAQQPQYHALSSMPTPEATPEKGRTQRVGRGGPLFNSGPLQEPSKPAASRDRMAAQSHSESDVVDDGEIPKLDLNSRPEVKVKKEPFGFAVRRKER